MKKASSERKVMLSVVDAGVPESPVVLPVMMTPSFGCGRLVAAIFTKHGNSPAA